MRALGSALVFLLLIFGHARAALADERTSVETLASCDLGDMPKVHVEVFSWKETSTYCDMARRSLGHVPELSSFRTLLRASYLISRRGGGTPKEVVADFLAIVEARGVSDVAQVASTYDTAFRIYVGTHGEVALRDLLAFLRSAGPAARTLSDEGLITSAATIQEMKRRRGG